MTRRSITKRAAIVAATALVTAGTVTAGVSLAGSESAKKPSEKQIAVLFDDWNAALRTGDPDKVADLYAKDAVLLPTVSDKVRTNHAEIADYFEHFLQNKPKGTKTESVVNVLDRDTVIDTGVYEFELTDHDTGAKSTVKARYTYAYEKQPNGKWLIVNHHSSKMPQG